MKYTTHLSKSNDGALLQTIPVVKYPSGSLEPVRGEELPEWASVSIKEASQMTGYNEEYLRRLIRQGKLEAVRVGPIYLIRLSDLRRYVEEMAGTADGRAGPRQK
jgi:excisionase family DNA binding protein